MNTSSQPLQRHLLKLVVVIQLVVFVMLFWVLDSYVSQLIRNNFVDSARTTAVDTSDMLVSTRALQSPDSLEDDLEQLLLKPGVVYAEVVVDGKRYLPTLLRDLPGQEVAESQFSEDYAVGSHGDQTYYLTMPLIDDRRLTFLRMGFDESDVQATLQQSRLAILGSLGTTAVLSILAVWFFSLRLTRPLLDLAEASRQIAEGQQESRLRIQSPVRELDILSHSLDDMHVKLLSRNRRLKHLASTDALTGIPNRLAFSNFLNRQVAASPKQVFGLVIIDINRFKDINDHHGHVVGDHVVSAVAQRLKQLSRDQDLIARIGGDEFALVLHDMSEIGIRRFCVNIGETISQPIEINGLILEVSASIGATLIEEAGLSPEDYIHQADMAMYEAKRNRDPYCLFGKQQFEDSVRETLIRKALSAGIESFSRLGLLVHYQPRFETERFRVTGVEALLRWEHGEFGSLSPEQFIPVAEREGFIIQLSDYVLDTAGAQVKEWAELGHALPVAINMSERDLRDPAFESRLHQVYQRYKIPYHLLEVEIAEGLALKDLELCADVITRLHRLGIPCYLDGARGRLNSQMLQALPVKGVKLDPRWIRQSLQDSKDFSAVETVLEQLKGLQLMVIATGVETEDMTTTLSDIGCHALQGFHFSRPVPPSFIESNFLLEN